MMPAMSAPAPRGPTKLGTAWLALVDRARQAEYSFMVVMAVTLVLLLIVNGVIIVYDVRFCVLCLLAL